MTCPDVTSARELVRGALKQHLIACANVMGACTSHYWWQDAIHEDAEVVVFGKTTQDRFASLNDWVVSQHPYECPCLIGLPISHGNPDFLKWIVDETKLP